jgi:hypothetical protein
VQVATTITRKLFLTEALGLNGLNGATVERFERLKLTATLVSDMPDVTLQKVTVGTRHRFP